jgi:hypothetical protein
MPRSGMASVMLVGLLVGCSSSTAPKPSIVGTWHVTLAIMNSGDSILPRSFDVKVRASGVGYQVTMPTLLWSGGLTFDSGPTLQTFTDSTKAGFIAYTHAPHARQCEWVSIYGTTNPGIDTLTGASFVVEYNDTIPGGCPLPTLGGIATIHK